MFILHSAVEQIVVGTRPLTVPLSEHILAMLLLASYIFLLRLPSEALPMSRSGLGYAGQVQQTVLSLEDGKVCLEESAKRQHHAALVLVCFAPLHMLCTRAVGELLRAVEIWRAALRAYIRWGCAAKSQVRFKAPGLC